MSKPSGATVRFRKGRTVDTGHVCGGDLSGLHGTIASPEFEANGVDGPKGQRRVVVAVEDDRAPAGAGIITAPVENLEPVSRWSRARACVAGIGRGVAGRPGRTRYKVRGGELVPA